MTPYHRTKVYIGYNSNCISTVWGKLPVYIHYDEPIRWSCDVVLYNKTVIITSHHHPTIKLMHCSDNFVTFSTHEPSQNVNRQSPLFMPPHRCIVMFILNLYRLSWHTVFEIILVALWSSLSAK